MRFNLARAIDFVNKRELIFVNKRATSLPGETDYTVT